MAFDFSTLPKVRTHANLGRLGYGECSLLNPATWTDCINVFRNARLEFQNNYTRVLQMEVSYQTALQTLNNGPDSPETSDLIAQTNQLAESAAQLRIEGINIANLLEAKISQYSSIPGFDTIFLNGLPGLGRLGTLGIAPLVLPPLTAGVIFYTVVGAVIMTATVWAVGQVAETWRAHEDTQIAQHNSWGACMQAYTAAVNAGQPPPACGYAPGQEDMTTLFLIAGAAILGVMVLMRR